jgi:hypothetical protein
LASSGKQRGENKGDAALFRLLRQEGDSQIVITGGNGELDARVRKNRVQALDVDAIAWHHRGSVAAGDRQQRHYIGPQRVALNLGSSD